MLLWPFNKYPGTDYETFNWDWLIQLGKRMEQVIKDLFSDTGALHQMVDKVLGEHPEWTTTVMDGAISWEKLTTSLQNRIAAGTVKLEEFPGTTTEQKIKYVLEHYENAVVEIGDITIDSTVLVSGDLDIRGVTFVDGTITLNADMLNTNRYAPAFSNVVFNGNGYKIAGSGAFIGMRLENCTIRNCQAYNRTSGYVQSFYMTGCDVNYMDVHFFIAPQVFDLKVFGNRFESSQFRAFNIQGGALFNVTQAVFVNNLFEGYATIIPLIFGTVSNMSIENNYFEGNHLGDIEFTSNNIRAVIENNFFNDQNISSTAVHIKGVIGIPDTLVIKNNRWNGIRPLTNLYLHWTNTSNNNDYSSPSMDISTFNYGTRHSFENSQFLTETFDANTHTTTIKFTVPRTYHQNIKSIRLLITGQQAQGSTQYRGYIDATLKTWVGYINGAVSNGVKVNINDSIVNNSGAGTPNLTATVSNTDPNGINVEITLVTTNFYAKPEIRFIDELAFGNLYDR